MPTTLTRLAAYKDDDGNVVEYAGELPHGPVSILFTGKNNRLVVHDEAKLARLSLRFDCDNGVVEIGANPHRRNLALSIRCGQDSLVSLGDGVSTTEVAVISAVEGTQVRIGKDCMIASANQLRADDGHPIFDVRSGKRVNVSRDIVVGDHVWLAREAVLLGGARVGSGSVVGYRAVVTGKIPNNCIAVGIPARVVRRNIAWERPHLSLVKPYYKPDASTVKKTAYWAMTEDDEAGGSAPAARVVAAAPLWRRALRKARRTAAQVLKRA